MRVEGPGNRSSYDLLRLRSVAIQRNIIMELAGGGEETASGQGPSVSAIVGCPDGGKMLTKALYILGRRYCSVGLYCCMRQLLI